MSAKFESIFSSNPDVDPNLSKIFERKLKPKKEKISAAEPKKPEDTKKKLKKLDPESEKRTVFVGNLHSGCKKEV